MTSHSDIACRPSTPLIFSGSNARKILPRSSILRLLPTPVTNKTGHVKNLDHRNTSIQMSVSGEYNMNCCGSFLGENKAMQYYFNISFLVTTLKITNLTST